MRKDHGIIFWPPAADIAALCHVSLKTAKRWRTGATRAPASVLMLLTGDLGAFDPQWSGWRLKRGLLVSPEGVEIAPGDARSLPFLRMQIAHYQAESRAAREHAPDIEEQPLPDSWDVQQVPG